MTGNKMGLTFLLPLLNSFLSGGGYLPAKISRKFCQELSYHSLGYKLSANLQFMPQEPFRSNMAAFREEFKCRKKQKQPNSESRFIWTEQQRLYYLGWQVKTQQKNKWHPSKSTTTMISFFHPAVFIPLSICSCVHHTSFKYQRHWIWSTGWGQRLCVQADLLHFQFYHLTSCVLGQVMWLL